jgi:hypothetical protein
MLESTKRGVHTSMTKEIPLTQGKVALVDDDDYPELSKHKWCALYQGKNRWYAVRSKRGRGGQITFRMHMVIMGTPQGMDTDHINGDGLDNRRENLRVVTHKGNMQNIHVPKSSKYPGVCWSASNKKWRSSTMINGEIYHIGYFKNEERAAMAYLKVCKNPKTVPKKRVMTSKFYGVIRNSKNKKYQVMIRINKKRVYFGLYADEETAGIISAMAKCAVKMGCVF